MILQHILKFNEGPAREISFEIKAICQNIQYIYKYRLYIQLLECAIPPPPLSTTTSTDYKETDSSRKHRVTKPFVNTSALIPNALVFFVNALRGPSSMPATSHGTFPPAQCQKIVKNHPFGYKHRKTQFNLFQIALTYQ